MNEQEWISETNPERMLNCFRTLRAAGGFARPPLFKTSQRKFRLLACAIARAALPSLTPRSIAAQDIATAERHADSMASDDDLAQARIASDLWCCDRSATIAAERSLGIVRAETACSLLREIFGNPFRPVEGDCNRCRPDQVDKYGSDAFCECRGTGKAPWLTPTVRAIAAKAYGGPCPDCAIHGFPDLRRPECNACSGSGRTPFDAGGLPVLADALEDAGCTDETILMHLRGNERCPRCGGAGGYNYAPGEDLSADCEACQCTGWRPAPVPHVRGCWCLDMILGKE